MVIGSKLTRPEVRWVPYLMAVRFSEEIHRIIKTTSSLK